MKNFRKVLAMILVVATLLSFATMASAKKETLTLDYADQATINPAYEAAVDILTAVGILNGYESGDEFNFKPTAEIDRDEVAKMIAVLANAGDDVQEYYAEACTFADVKNTWAASYVAYCYHAGYVDGRNATTFDPDASITGYEVAKMLLCLMGFDADEQGYVGKDWKVNVMRDAKNFGLIDNLAKDFNLKNNATRQEVAQMMFNCLMAPIVVGYVSENIVKITNAAYADLGIALPDLGVADDFRIVYGNVVIYPQAVGEFYGIDQEIAVDCYGRPGYLWSAGKWSKFYPAAGTTAYDVDKVTADYVFIDGAKQEGTFNKTAIEAGKGDIVSTYTLAGKKFVTVNHPYVDVVVRTFKELGKQYYVLASDESKKIENKAGYSVGDVLVSYTCNSKAHGKCIVLEDYVYAAGTHATAVLKPEKVAVTRTVHKTEDKNPSAWDETNSYFMAGSKKYEYAHEYLMEDIMDTDQVGGTYAVYMVNGYVVAWTAWREPDTTVYEIGYFVENTWEWKWGNTQSAAAGIDTHYYNNVVDFAAKESKVEVEEDLFDFFYPATDDYVGLLAKYHVEDGVVYVDDVAIRGHINTIVAEKGEIDVEGPDGEYFNVSATTNTKFLVRTLDLATGKYTYKAYTGYKALSKDYPDQIIASQAGAPATIQYFVDATNPNKATFVFIDAALATAANEFYLVGYAESQSDIAVNDVFAHYDVYDVLVNGEKAKMLISLADKDEELEPGMYEKTVQFLGAYVDGLPIYVAVKPVSQDDMITDIVEFVELSGDQLYFKKDNGEVNNAPMADEFVIWLLDYKADGKFNKMTKFTTEDAFNAELVDNLGYVITGCAFEYDNNGFVTRLFVSRQVG